MRMVIRCGMRARIPQKAGGTCNLEIGLMLSYYVYHPPFVIQTTITTIKLFVIIFTNICGYMYIT